MISNFLEQKQKQKQNAEESRTADTGLDYNCSRRGGGECWIGTGLLWQPPKIWNSLSGINEQSFCVESSV